MDNYLQSQNMLRCRANPNAYYHHDSRGIVILLQHVDDVKITSTSMPHISKLKQQLHHEFAMTNLGSIQRFPGVEYTRSDNGLLLHETSYSHELLAQFKMEAFHPSHISLNEGTKLRKDISTRPYDIL